MTSKQRFGEIDLLRAIAIVLMVLFHLVYDLREFAGVNINYEDPVWFLIGKTSALLFMFLSGLASGFSRSTVKRGIKVLLLGMGITVVTYLVMKDMYVRFGILHFLGVTMILAPFFYALSAPILWALAVVSALLGFWFKKVFVQTSLLLPLGLIYKGFGSMDYYPLFPYISATFLGVLAFRHFYAPTSTPIINVQLKSKPILWLSRNSLWIYLAHQPIILLIIFSIRFF